MGALVTSYNERCNFSRTAQNRPPGPCHCSGNAHFTRSSRETERLKVAGLLAATTFSGDKPTLSYSPTGRGGFPFGTLRRWTRVHLVQIGGKCFSLLYCTELIGTV